MATRRVQCPAHLEPGPAERAMLGAVPGAMAVVGTVVWCELDHHPTTSTRTDILTADTADTADGDVSEVGPGAVVW